MSIIEFINQMVDNPMLLVSTILTLGVILVNGWTDAPNAIATCVSTRAISVRKAIIMATIFNLLFRAVAFWALEWRNCFY